jgi:hypothetical protein
LHLPPLLSTRYGQTQARGNQPKVQQFSVFSSWLSNSLLNSSSSTSTR